MEGQSSAVPIHLLATSLGDALGLDASVKPGEDANHHIGD